MIKTIEHIDQVTPEWLTYVLKESGHLPQGEVEAFSKEQSHLEGLTSDRYHLDIVYSKSAPKSAPDRLFLKIGKPGSLEFCKKEIEFYRMAIHFESGLSLLTCYDSSYSSESKHSHLLLQDLSKTHFPPNLTTYRREPDIAFPLTRLECESAVECLAAVHASWWNNPRLGSEVGERTPAEISRQFFKKDLKEMMVSIFDILGERVSPQRRRIYESALASYPDLYWKYLDEGAPLTIRHADTHLGNFMFPQDRDQDQDSTILLDWQSWGVDLGITDLAYMMALNWYPNQRLEMERDLILHYHNQLLKGGVTGYTWDECWFGYRLQAIWMLLIPFWFSSMLPLHHTWAMMERSYAAFQDLQCMELLADTE